MIFIDSRKGSMELADLIEDSVLTILEFGDVCFEGNGPNGKLQIGIERKRTGDLIQSIQSGRLSGHQLPGLLECYDRVYLIVEGLWQAHRKTGVVEVFRHGRFKPLGESRFTSKRIWGYLVSLNATTGVTILSTPHMVETALLITELHQWWNERWENHVAHIMSSKASPPTVFLRPGQPPLIRRLAMELPGIGYLRVGEVEKKFKTVQRMWNASEEEWKKVEGIGKITAKKVYQALHE